MVKLNKELLEQVKAAFIPMPGGQPEQDPNAMAGGQPPMDPAMMAQGGGMPQDPSMMQGDPNAMAQGGMPPGVDPSAQGMDPNAQGGDPNAAAGGDPTAGMDPAMLAQLGMDPNAMAAGGAAAPAQSADGSSSITITVNELIALLGALKGGGSKPEGEAGASAGESQPKKANSAAKLDQILALLQSATGQPQPTSGA